MDDYPAFEQLLSSVPESVDDRVLDRSEGGGVKIRAMFPTEKKRFTIVHRLTQADVVTMQSFYTAHRLEAITFEWLADHTSYTVLFESAPKYDYTNKPRIDVTCVLVEQ